MRSALFNTYTRVHPQLQQTINQSSPRAVRTVAVGADQGLGARVGVDDSQALVSNGVVAVHLFLKSEEGGEGSKVRKKRKKEGGRSYLVAAPIRATMSQPVWFVCEKME